MNSAFGARLRAVVKADGCRSEPTNRCHRRAPASAVSTAPLPQPISRNLLADEKKRSTKPTISLLRATNQKWVASSDASFGKKAASKLSVEPTNSGARIGTSSCTGTTCPHRPHRQPGGQSCACGSTGSAAEHEGHSLFGTTAMLILDTCQGPPGKHPNRAIVKLGAATKCDRVPDGGTKKSGQHEAARSLSSRLECYLRPPAVAGAVSGLLLLI